MRKVELIRVESTDEATLGGLLVDGKSICWTLEEPWRENKQNISCIPVGRYPIKLEYSPSKRCELWTVKDVPGRSYVRIHKGNTVDDTEGCPLTGIKPGYLEGKRAVLGSREAFKEFMDAMNGSSEGIIEISYSSFMNS
ncbi:MULTISPECIES: DUF5675 family protein [unclassified Maridesulfovibrio]|uniref:DUF5675 family protein n=1 Tax=unclassified Maridesulfovibrio TaxID=2794999 RepID=UPI003B408C8A